MAKKQSQTEQLRELLESGGSFTYLYALQEYGIGSGFQSRVHELREIYGTRLKSRRKSENGKSFFEYYLGPEQSERIFAA